MDLDAFAAEHGAEWRRLDVLTSRPGRSLSAAEVDELVVLYRRAATHLSMVQSRSPDPELTALLTRLVLRGRAAVSPSAGFRWSGLRDFFVVSFPLEVYRAAGWCTGVGAAFVALSAVLIAVVAGDPAVALRFMSQDQIDSLVQRDFEAYYSSGPAENFGFAVWTNNAWVSAVCLAAGVIVLPVLYVLWQNALNLGVVGGVMVGHGRSDTFFGLLLVHGLLELTCVFVAAGVGLRIGWSWLAPGPLRTRGEAVATAGRSGVAVALGLVPVLLVSGVVEAFVTPAALPSPVKLLLGTLVWLAFLGYVGVLGSAAARAGRSADVDWPDRAAQLPTV
ncbi:stage II sporulation protein M [Micromonospora echinofusca]|uniref:Stage II sporulation protein M n=1 Tax=Micromonospora echinofusca TaxID=47858 RepID=A0ABS3VMA7_MICEH|nr:stage II sporulation protein M [Micromonospora echinofusca]MBO4205641.1 stage II sporulation protein M [Micromonospora echinofusca]